MAVFVSALSVPKLSDEQAQAAVELLNRLTAEIKARQVPGFVQAYLLRSAGGGAQIMALWRSHKDLERYLASEPGREALAEQAKVLKVRPEAVQQYRITWQARYTEEAN